MLFFMSIGCVDEYCFRLEHQSFCHLITIRLPFEIIRSIGPCAVAFFQMSGLSRHVFDRAFPSPYTETNSTSDLPPNSSFLHGIPRGHAVRRQHTVVIRLDFVCDTTNTPIISEVDTRKHFSNFRNTSDSPRILEKWPIFLSRANRPVQYY